MSAGGVVFALFVSRTGTLNGLPATATSYFHHDQLGSISAITNENGAVVERLAYDPWGKRRMVNTTPGLADNLDALVGQRTDRGYTMHEHLDEVGLTHMNGRLYDPVSGRFTSADPYIQTPDSLQAFNRYVYVNNNPLSYTDPSGYFSLKKLLKVAIGIAVGYITGQWIGDVFKMQGLLGNTTFATMGGSLNGLGATIAGAGGGFAAGAVTSGSLNGALQGALSGGLFGAAGSVGADASFGRYAAHAAAGCVSSAAGGGKCGSGAASAVFGKFATNNITIQDDLARGIATTVAGGVGSVIAGGKFENGATTAAFGYLYNYCASFTVKCFGEWAHNGGKVVMGVLGVKAAVGACAGTAGIACGPALMLGAWGVNEAVEGATYFRAPDVEGFNPAKVGLMSLTGALGSPAVGEYTYYGLSLGMNVWSAGTATQLWLTTPRLGGGWLTTGYAWQSMNSGERTWTLFDSYRTVNDATNAAQK